MNSLIKPWVWVSPAVANQLISTEFVRVIESSADLQLVECNNCYVKITCDVVSTDKFYLAYFKQDK